MSVGFIGNFTNNDLTENQIHVFKSLIDFGCKKKYVLKNYKIYGFTQNNEDGKCLFEKISQLSQWGGFVENRK